MYQYDIWYMSLCIDDRLVCRIDTINSPDDGHMAARNMWRIEINIHENELCVKLVIYTDVVRLFGLCTCFCIERMLYRMDVPQQNV